MYFENSKKSKNVLTKREKEVMSYVIQGFSNSEIANTLFISNSTVKAHISSVLEKLGAKNRFMASLILLNIKNNLGK